MTKYKCETHGIIAHPHKSKNCFDGEVYRCPVCFARLDEI